MKRTPFCEQNDIPVDKNDPSNGQKQSKQSPPMDEKGSL